MRQISEYVARARQMPPHVLAQKVGAMAWRKARRTWAKNYYSSLGSYSDKDLNFEEPLFKAPEVSQINKHWDTHWEPVLNKIMKHQFDLLGSGWVSLDYGASVPGTEGHIYTNDAKQASPDKIQSAQFLNSSNQEQARRILKNINTPYSFIDWHVDFKSGFRWNPSQWWEEIPYGHKPGVDIKVPWELSRMQHLPWLAYGFQKTGQDKYKEEFRNQVLDFIGNNPPRFGVNWKCPMDVAIRTANWLVAFDLFRSQGATFDNDFERILANSLFDHGLFVSQNFEKGTDFRGNHYLADIAGLSFIAFYLKGDEKIQNWRELCQQEVLNEALYQFHDLGSNFEGSTAYHRLSSEMLIYPVLLFLLHQKKSPYSESQWNPLLKQIRGMGLFAQQTTKPTGDIVQVGDNDSGRFLKLSPAWVRKNETITENHLDLNHLVQIVDALFLKEDFNLETSILKKSLSTFSTNLSHAYKNLTEDHFQEVQKPFKTSESSLENKKFQEQTYKFDIPEASLEGLKGFCYKDFGLVIYKAKDFFLSFRCGPVGQLGRGGHDHNDQLSIELYHSGQTLIADPGTYLYTAAPELRNQYRSNQNHFCPQPINQEMGGLDAGLFFIKNAAPGRLLQFSQNSCLGRSDGFGFPITRSLNLLKNQIIITDCLYSDRPLFDLHSLETLPYSAGYGLVEEKQ